MLFTPYEPFLEGVIALIIIATAVAGFLMHPRREVFYVRTSVRLIDANRNQALEQDFLAVRVEPVRLWLLFVPTFLAVAFLVFFAAGGPMKFSFLNWIFSSPYVYAPIMFLQYAPLLVLILLSVWIGERRVMRMLRRAVQSPAPFLTAGTEQDRNGILIPSFDYSGARRHRFRQAYSSGPNSLGRNNVLVLSPGRVTGLAFYRPAGRSEIHAIREGVSY